MKNNDPSAIFDENNADSYDANRSKLAAIIDSLHLCLRSILSSLPDDANILCVGAGTGAELINLANAFPGWKFSVVEPSPQMLSHCRQQAEKNRILSRCTFHGGYLDSFSSNDLHDAATSILVSHFIIDETERINFFTKIASFIKPNGYLVNADLSANTSDEKYNDLIDVWVNLHNYAGIPANIESFERKVAVVSQEKIESILSSSGFEKPVLFFQAIFIKAWYSRVNKT